MNLRREGIFKQFNQCPYCESAVIGRVRRDKFKCYECRKEWGPRRGSILEGLRVPLVRVLIVIKLFELDTSVREAAHQLDLSSKTVYDLFDLFRQSIVRTDIDPSLTLSGEIEMNKSYFGGRIKKETGAGELPGRSRYSVSWSVGEKSGLRLYRMSVERRSSIWLLRR